MTPQELSEVFKVLSNPRRVEIFQLLMESDSGMSSGYISHQLDIPLGPTSHNLRLLAKSGLLTYKKEGRNVYYWPERNIALEVAAILLIKEPPPESYPYEQESV